MSNEKPEEQVDKEKAAVLSLRSAQSNMSKTIEHIDRLTRALESLCQAYDHSIKHISPDVYMYNSTKTCRDAAKDSIAAARKVL